MPLSICPQHLPLRHSFAAVTGLPPNSLVDNLSNSRTVTTARLLNLWDRPSDRRTYLVERGSDAPSGTGGKT